MDSPILWQDLIQIRLFLGRGRFAGAALSAPTKEISNSVAPEEVLMLMKSSLQPKAPGHIGRLGDLWGGQVTNVYIGQVSNKERLTSGSYGIIK